MTDIFDPYFRGLSDKERDLMEVLIYDLLERGHQIEIDSFISYMKVLERLPDVFRQIQSNFEFEFENFKTSIDAAMKTIEEAPNDDVVKQFSIFRSFINRS